MAATGARSASARVPVDSPLPDARPFSWRFTAPLLIGSALNPVNSSLIATGLVPIARGLNVPLGQTAVLVTALYLASAIAQPTAGKAAEVFGPRRVFLVGIVLVAVGGVVGGVAQDLPTLVFSRVLIGLGTSCAYPTAMLLIRRRALDAASLGLPIGGVLVGGLGWRAIFFVNVPVALIALSATLAWVAPDIPSDRTRSAREIAARLDVIGILGFATAMIALLLFLFELPAVRWYALAISVALWLALVAWELRAATPFLDVRLLASNRPLTSTYVRYGLVLLCVYIVFYGMTEWVETDRGLSETEAGLLLLPMTLVSAVVISLVARRNAVRVPVIAAAFACLVGSGGLLLISTSAWIGWIVAITVVFGIAIGATSAGNQTALYAHAPAQQLGTASGLMRTFGYVGSIASSAIVGIVFRSQVTDDGLHHIAWIMLGISVVLVAISVTDRA
jgi:MFS family permease